MKIVKFKDRKKQHRFRIVARNGRILAASEGYVRRKDRDNCIVKLQSDLLNAEVVEED